MCGRIFRTSDVNQIRARFRTAEPRHPFSITYNGAPGQLQPVVLHDRDAPGVRTLDTLKWGLVPFWAKDPKVGYSMINARAEGIEKKPAYREAVKHRRCLVPVSGFYEWQGETKNKKAYAFEVEDQPLFALAGLWDRWKGEDGEELRTFTIITTEPNRLMKPIHDRMPVILHDEDWARWLGEEGDPAPPLELLKPYPASRTRMWHVGPAVGSPKNNSPEVLAPAA